MHGRYISHSVRNIMFLIYLSFKKVYVQSVLSWSQYQQTYLVDQLDHCYLKMYFSMSLKLSSNFSIKCTWSSYFLCLTPFLCRVSFEIKRSAKYVSSWNRANKVVFTTLFGNKQTIKFTINKIEKLYDEYKAYKARYTSDINFKQIIWITVWGEQMAHCFEFVTFSKYMFSSAQIQNNQVITKYKNLWSAKETMLKNDDLWPRHKG